ncbi:MAG: heavy metal translocating P-type ATPase [Longimicrobiales bacterium]
MTTVELPIRGMDCPSCAASVRDALCAVPGVSAVDVRLGAEKAVIEYDAASADPSLLAAAVAAVGYAVPEAALAGVARTSPFQDEAAGFVRRSLAVTGLVFGAVLVVVVVGEWLGVFEAATRRIPLAVGVLIVALVGWPAFRGVARAALRGRVISHTLMAVGVLAALVIGQWVTAAVVAFFMRVGDFVESFTVRRGRRALRDLAALAPRTARVDRDGRVADVAIGEVRLGDVVVVRPGERIPVDGVVLIGQASVEQAAITGESMPVEVGAGARVFAATIARGGALRVRVDRVGEDATFGRIVRMVEEAEARRGRLQSFADRFSGWYLPVVATVALVTFIVRRDPLATAAVLVVACSCAFAIATPVAMLATIGAAARRGLLIKGGAYIEALARADVILVDKTGTFTLGRPSVHEVVVLDPAVDTDDVVRLAASAERDSEHPLAAAILAEAGRRGLVTSSPSAFRALEGAGVTAEVEGARVLVGSARVAASAQTGPDAAAPFVDAGVSTAFVVRDGERIGAIGFRDEIRPDVPAALAALRELGFTRIELLTGDHEPAAAPVAARLGVDYRADLLPEDKIAIVREHQRRGRTVIMIGDGVNDAPALAQADVGIAMGAAGTDLALEVSHVALLRDDWTLVPDAIRTARRTMRVVKGNFGFTGLYNLVGLTLAAVGILPPILAAAAQSIPDLGILGNSMRLLRPVKAAEGR